MIAQTLHDWLMNIPEEGIFNRFIYAVLLRIRNLIKEYGDPLIRHKIGRFYIVMPISHDLIVIEKKYPHYSQNIGRIAGLIQTKYHNLSIVDIGANVGDSISVLRNHVSCPILAIEGNERYFSILRENCSLWDRVTIAKALLGEVKGEIHGCLQTKAGTASITQSEQEASILNIQVVGDVIERHPGFKEAKFVKIDTDGYDGKIIRGGLPWFKQARPVIFFEYDPFYLQQNSDDGLSIFTELSLAGYTTMLVYCNTGEYLQSGHLHDLDFLKSFHDAFVGHYGRKYADVCVFHKDDQDVFELIKQQEPRHETIS